jgi:hypothetical protein
MFALTKTIVTNEAKNEEILLHGIEWWYFCPHSIQ